jgi:hypothetical protein
MRVLNLSQTKLSTAISVALLLSISPSAYAKDKQTKGEANQDADRKVAELAVDLNNQIASTFESDLPCELRAPKNKKGEKELADITPQSKIPLFQSREIADMEIQADFKAIMAERKGGPTTPGKILYRLKDGRQVSLPVEIGNRGHSKQGICVNFKPLVLHFKKEDTRGTVFEHIGDHVKLGTHCSGMGSHDITEPNSQFVVREAAAYQILEDNGFLSYKTRLTNMKYRDANGKPVASGIAFFLEPDGKMAERWGYKHSKVFNGMPQEGYVDFKLGSQLVGAIDHSPGHNTTALKKGDQLATMAFYDLDMSLLVNPVFYLRWEGKENISSIEDILAINAFIQDHAGGAEAGRQFLKRALSRKEHTMKIVDKLPIKEKKFIKDRLDLWYGAIETSLNQRDREPAALTIPKDLPQGTYNNW